MCNQNHSGPNPKNVTYCLRPLLSLMGNTAVYVLDINENLTCHTVVSDVHSYATRSGHNLVFPRCKPHPITDIKFFNHPPVKVRDLSISKFFNVQ